MGKVTFVVDFPDGQEPSVHAGMQILGGKLAAVSFFDALSQADELFEVLEEIVSNAYEIEHDYYGLQGHEEFDPKEAIAKAVAIMANAKGES
ncbi:hypothetical protein B7L51_019235 [Pectobacterium brasiliense]|uniref:hypothetical protein n=1 Tax=Pectobacterium brasiliense TaxID=180957 RepID=UPI00114020E0|nr:hypothetical protein [Pectobacterium carotovorum]